MRNFNLHIVTTDRISGHMHVLMAAIPARTAQQAEHIARLQVEREAQYIHAGDDMPHDWQTDRAIFI